MASDKVACYGDDQASKDAGQPGRSYGRLNGPFVRPFIVDPSPCICSSRRCVPNFTEPQSRSSVGSSNCAVLAPNAASSLVRALRPRREGRVGNAPSSSSAEDLSLRHRNALALAAHISQPLLLQHFGLSLDVLRSVGVCHSFVLSSLRSSSKRCFHVAELSILGSLW